MRFLLITLGIFFCFIVSFADTVDTDTLTVRQYQIKFRLDMTYVPVNSIDFNNWNSTYEVYDNLFYHFGAEYIFMDFISVGPSVEYMSKHIEPVSIFHRDITAYNILMDFKLLHNLTDTGRAKMLFGFGTGVANLKEKNGESNSDIIFYGVLGFDFALWRDLGIDLIYRYQLSKLEVEYREYHYNGSTIQFGLNYGLNL